LQLTLLSTITYLQNI